MTDEHFRGSRQYYQQAFADCMTISREVGKPDLLITFTMDPVCPEIDEMTLPDQEWFDRPDVVCRLFVDKLKEFEKDLTVREVLGPVRAWFYSVEHQKRFVYFVFYIFYYSVVSHMYIFAFVLIGKECVTCPVEQSELRRNIWNNIFVLKFLKNPILMIRVKQQIYNKLFMRLL